MKINIWTIPYGWFYAHNKTNEFKIEEQGYLEMETFSEGECWHICNWTCWTDTKPDFLISELGVVNSNVIFHNPLNNKFYLAKPNEWLVASSLNEITEHCLQYKKNIIA